MLTGILFLLIVLASYPSDAATKAAVPLRVAYSSILEAVGGSALDRVYSQKTIWTWN